MAKMPVAIGLSLCEQVVIEEKTRNVTLVNCFSVRTAKKFPTASIPFTVFALLTDGLGDVTLEVVIERLDTLDDVYRKSIRVRFPRSLATLRFIHRVRDCVFPISGEYQVKLLADGEFLAQRKIAVLPKA